MGQMEDLYLFTLVVVNRSLSKAADLLNIAKSAVSRRLNLLEERYKDVVQRFSSRAVMKDSFCQMDAHLEGLEVLFDASWIWFGKDKQCPSYTWKGVKSNSD